MVSNKFKIYEMLLMLFHKFNRDDLNRIEYPIKYSMSCGDIVEIECKFYVTDSCGFKQLNF